MPKEPLERRRWLGRLGLASGAMIGALILAEVLVRILGIAPARWIQARHLESGDKRAGVDVYPDDPRGYFPLDLRDEATRAHLIRLGIPDLAQQAERTPFAVPFAYTEELCRGEAIVSPKSGEARVVVIGDSFAEGQGVREEDTFASILDERLDRAQVINCGRRGYDFPELHEWFDAHLALAPDVVVYAMTLNDPQRSEAFHGRQPFIDDWILDRRRMVTEGDGSPPPLTPRLFALVMDRIEGARVGAATTLWYREMVDEPNREGWLATIEHITQMRDAMTERGGELVVVLWPLLIDLGDDYPFVGTHETIGAALRAANVPFFDALPELRGENETRLWVHAVDHHPNERAHALFADVAERAVEPLL